MSRPAAVTASGVVALIGSFFTLLLGILMIVAGFATQVPGVDLRGMVFVTAVGAIAFAGLGFATAVGLFRLRPWARTSILIFAGIMAVISLMTALMMAVVPIPPTPGSNVSVATVRWVMAGAYAIPVAIGVWWLVLFNRSAIQAAFASGETGQPSRRPLSISIIGWLFLVGGIFTVIVGLTGIPAQILSWVLQGWAARIVYFLMGAIGSFLGWGLLRLDERARILTLVWSALGLLHGAYFIISPTARERMREVQGMVPIGAPPPPSPAGPPDLTAITMVILALSLAVIALSMWFLVRNKPAFQDEAPVGPPAYGA